jgi:hypothetical protein
MADHRIELHDGAVAEDTKPVAAADSVSAAAG